METVPKPDELLALHDVSAELFEILQRWFDVPGEVTLDLTDVDAAIAELSDPVMIAAMAMRKLQGLRLLATPGVTTSTDVVVAIVQDLERAMVEAPTLRLQRSAQQADWDAALAGLVEGELEEDAPTSADAEDAEVARFRGLHERLHEALRATITASDGEIRYLR